MKMILQRYSGLSWQVFVSWFLGLPLFGQILVAVGLVTIIVLVFIGIYYLLKGIGYLIYYILKAIYYIIRGVIIGIFRVFQGIFHAFSEKEEPKESKTTEVEQEQSQPIEAQKEQISPVQEIIVQNQPKTISYCPECGVEFTEIMSTQLNKEGYAYCTFCGEKFQSPATTAAES